MIWMTSTSPRNAEIVVGAIGSTVDVSALGGATYTIPIQLPQGLGGIQPNLAISYNNQGGNGLLGWCWDLQGISCITRLGTTLYHDGRMSGVDFYDDRFALDGQRLICLSGNYGENGSEYRTEIDNTRPILVTRQMDRPILKYGFLTEISLIMVIRQIQELVSNNIMTSVCGC